MRRMKMLGLGVLSGLLLSGCGIIHVYSAANVARATDPAPVKPTRATLALGEADMDRDVFVGIAMSGGGARAANFSAATLLELERLGFLAHASAISAVSGSALTAAYYGIYARPDQPQEERAKHWNSESVRERFLLDFQTQWLIQWFNPWNIGRYWLTDFDRSDMMAAVFDALLFEGRSPPRFEDMGAGRPKILINATSLPGVGAFVFTDEEFERLGSRLDRYPVSHAIMASGAFPGAFHNVTLEDFARKGYYQHLFDGGPSDNLGVLTLLKVVDRVRPKRGCFLFMVDAFPYQTGAGEKRSDTRRALDFFVDRNVSESADVFLTLRRYDTLERRLGYRRDIAAGVIPQWSFTTDGGIECSVWHLTFQSLIVRPQTREDLKKKIEDEKQVNLIPTRYRLEGPRPAREIQNLIFDVANHLLLGDDAMLKAACEWFRARGLPACNAVSAGGR